MKFTAEELKAWARLGRALEEGRKRESAARAKYIRALARAIESANREG